MLWQQEAALIAHTNGRQHNSLSYISSVWFAKLSHSLHVLFFFLSISFLAQLFVLSFCSVVQGHTLATIPWLCMVGECVCKWGRSGLLVSQRDWPALWKVDLKSRSQSQGLGSHLPPLSLHTQQQFWHSLRLPDPTSCGRFMTSWLPHPLHSPVFFFSSILTAAGALHGNVFTFLSWQAKPSHWADIFYLLNQISVWTRGQRDLVTLFSHFLNSLYIYAYSWLVFVHLFLSLCYFLLFCLSLQVLWPLVFDWISLSLCSSCSLLDTAPVKFPVSVTDKCKVFFFGQQRWNLVEPINSGSEALTLQRALLFIPRLRPLLQTVTYCSLFALWSGRAL